MNTQRCRWAVLCHFVGCNWRNGGPRDFVIKITEHVGSNHNRGIHGYHLWVPIEVTMSIIYGYLVRSDGQTDR